MPAATPGSAETLEARESGQGLATGSAVWVHDVFAFRGWPAAWSEELVGVDEGARWAFTGAIAWV
jgi:hypothetical protein